MIAYLPAFGAIRDAVLGVAPGNPLISLTLSVNILAGITGSASGGVSIALRALEPDYMALAVHAGISPEHRCRSAGRPDRRDTAWVILGRILGNYRRRRQSTQQDTGNPVSVDLALQGGGAHGAFNWGVLDCLLGVCLAATTVPPQPRSTAMPTGTVATWATRHCSH